MELLLETLLENPKAITGEKNSLSIISVGFIVGFT